uniref:Secreted protein n=1 Tax=Cacopsylla melanoneura TaxID=428564 RepID=A0A8D9E5G9_9HEMI
MNSRWFVLLPVIILGDYAGADTNTADRVGHEYFRSSLESNPPISKCKNAADSVLPRTSNPYKYPTQSIWYRPESVRYGYNFPLPQRRHNTNPMLDRIHQLFNFRYNFWDRQRSLIQNKFPVCRRRPNKNSI